MALHTTEGCSSKQNTFLLHSHPDLCHNYSGQCCAPTEQWGEHACCQLSRGQGYRDAFVQHLASERSGRLHITNPSSKHLASRCIAPTWPLRSWTNQNMKLDTARWAYQLDTSHDHTPPKAWIAINETKITRRMEFHWEGRAWAETFAPVYQVPPPLEPVHLQSSHCAHRLIIF